VDGSIGALAESAGSDSDTIPAGRECSDVHSIALAMTCTYRVGEAGRRIDRHTSEKPARRGDSIWRALLSMQPSGQYSLTGD